MFCMFVHQSLVAISHSFFPSCGARAKYANPLFDPNYPETRIAPPSENDLANLDPRDLDFEPDEHCSQLRIGSLGDDDIFELPKTPEVRRSLGLAKAAIAKAQIQVHAAPTLCMPDEHRSDLMVRASSRMSL